MSLNKIILPDNPNPVLVDAVREAGLIPSFDVGSVLIWRDYSITNLDETDFKIEKFRISNHITSSDILCYWSSFCRLVQKLQLKYPDEYYFIPKTFILPYEKLDFLKVINKGKKEYIYKRDKEKEFYLNPTVYLSVSEEPAIGFEKIETARLDQKHFHLKFFVLIPSIRDLKIYVYKESFLVFDADMRRGVPADSDDVHLFSDFFPTLENDFGLSPDKFIESINQIIILSVLAGYQYLIRSAPPLSFYPNEYQIMTFNFIFDQEWVPYLLSIEPTINLEYHSRLERKIKTRILAQAFNIIAPIHEMQEISETRKYWTTNDNAWKDYVNNHPGLPEYYKNFQEKLAGYSDFNKIYPDDNPLYSNILKTVMASPFYIIPGYH